MIVESREIEAWGEKISVAIDYDTKAEKDVLPEQKEAIEAFLHKPGLLTKSTLEIWDYLRAKGLGKEIKEKRLLQMITPKMLLAIRMPDIRAVAAICDVAEDIDEGIVILFENEEFVRLGQCSVRKE